MRERRVPCRNATFAEVRSGRHLTWNDSAICDRCALPAARVAAGDDGSAAVVPSFSPAGASRTASQQSPVGDHP